MPANIDCSVPANRRYGGTLPIEMRYDQNRKILNIAICRKFQMLLEDKLPHELAVFREYEEGEHWLLKEFTRHQKSSVN